MNEALRLADALQSGADDPMWADHCEMSKRTCAAAATELRRLHDLLGKANALCRIRAARIKELETLNAELVEALQTIMAGVAGCERDSKWEAARAALANSKVNLEGKAK